MEWVGLEGTLKIAQFHPVPPSLPCSHLQAPPLWLCPGSSAPAPSPREFLPGCGAEAPEPGRGEEEEEDDEEDQDDEDGVSAKHRSRLHPSILSKGSQPRQLLSARSCKEHFHAASSAQSPSAGCQLAPV